MVHFEIFCQKFCNLIAVADWFCVCNGFQSHGRSRPCAKECFELFFGIVWWIGCAYFKFSLSGWFSFAKGAPEWSTAVKRRFELWIFSWICWKMYAMKSIFLLSWYIYASQTCSDTSKVSSTQVLDESDHEGALILIFCIKIWQRFASRWLLSYHLSSKLAVTIKWCILRFFVKNFAIWSR